MATMNGPITPDLEIDARGMLCPLPVLRARKVLLTMSPGQTLLIWATDPMAVIDIPHFCIEAGHHLVETREDAKATGFFIRRG